MRNIRFVDIQDKSVLYLFALLITLLPVFSFSQDNGETIFLSVCHACHTIGQGKLIGPDLANVQDRLETDWLLKFIKSSQKMVKSGDAEAVRVFNEFNKMIMPDLKLSDTQIVDVLNYIKKRSTIEKTSKGVDGKPLMPKDKFGLANAGKEDFNIGLKYFSGQYRFKNGGPACLSCHNVTNDNIMGGGQLSKDLTKAYSRLSAAGVDAIVSSSPFPVMRTAFSNNQLTPDEKHYLLVFLKQADLDSVNQSPVNYQRSFIFKGAGGLIVLFGLFALIWSKRKKETVKKEIFARQLKSNQ